jgi:hypothetical protein
VLAFWRECEEYVNKLYIPLGFCFDVIEDEKLVLHEYGRIDENVLKIAFDKLARIELELKYSVNPQNLFEAVCVSLIANKNVGGASVQQVVAESPDLNNVQTYNTVNESELNNKNNTNTNSNILSQNINSNTLTQNTNSSVNAVVQNINKESDNVDKLWGSVLLEIKKRNMFALSSSLKDIYGVHMIGNCLILKTNDQSVLKSVDEPSRLDVILSIASSFNGNIKKVEVKYDETNKSSKDVAMELKNIFMDKLKIKE